MLCVFVKTLMLSIFTGLTFCIYTMDDTLGDNNSYQAVQEYRLEENQNLLQKIYNFMPELLRKIMDYLPVDDPGYNYLKLYGHFDITKDQAERAIDIFFQKLIIIFKKF